MPIVHSDTYSFAYSLNKQADMATGLADGALNKNRSMRNFGPITKEPVHITDRNWFGKGHGWSTFADRVTELYRIPAQERSATALETLYAAAFVMGKDTAGGSSGPSGYTHSIEFQDPTTNTEVLYTSVGEAMGSEFKNKLTGAWINSFTLTGNRADHVVISFEGQGRKLETSTFTVPALTATAFYKTLYGTVSFGATGGPTDISAQVLSWNFTANQNAQPMFLMGNSAGDEMRLSKCLIGKQSANASAVVFVSSTFRNFFLNEQYVALTLVLKSPDVVAVGGAQHSCTITIPKMLIASEAFGLEGSTVAYTLNFTEDYLIYDGVNPTVKLDFVTNIGTTELLVEA